MGAPPVVFGMADKWHGRVSAEVLAKKNGPLLLNRLGHWHHRSNVIEGKARLQQEGQKYVNSVPVVNKMPWIQVGRILVLKQFLYDFSV
jgi:hypothetical protein